MYNSETRIFITTLTLYFVMEKQSGAFYIDIIKLFELILIIAVDSATNSVLLCEDMWELMELPVGGMHIHHKPKSCLDELIQEQAKEIVIELDVRTSNNISERVDLA